MLDGVIWKMSESVLERIMEEGGVRMIHINI